jgi:transposase-like protein
MPNSNGQREVLGIDIGPCEVESFSTAFLLELARRTLRDAKVVVSNAEKAIFD